MEIDDYIIASDVDLVRLVLAGDSVAFEHLFNRYQGSIHQLYMQRTAGNADDTDDLLQETFVKVYLNIHKYNPDFTFGQWIYTIARNTFVDYVRKRRDDLSIDNAESKYMTMNTQSQGLTPEESIINSQQRAELDRLMSQMPPRYRILIELRFFKEYSYEEIAQKRGLPLGTVKTQIHRARELLCKLLRMHQIV